MKQEAVQTSGPAIRLRRLAAAGGQDRTAPGESVLGSLRLRAPRQAGASGPVPGRADQRAEIVDSQAAVAHDSNHRHAEFLLEFRRIDLAASRLQFVDHRQGDADRQTQGGCLGQQRQAPFDRGGVHDHHDPVRSRLAETTLKHPNCDRLVFRLRLQAVDAGQIDQPDVVGSEPSLEIALAPVDRDARVVPGLGPMPGEGVEQCRLARVRSPQDRDTPGTPRGRGRPQPDECRHAPARWTRIRRASLRRRLRSAPRSSYIAGSPSGARRMNRTGAPVQKPISRRRLLAAPLPVTSAISSNRPSLASATSARVRSIPDRDRTSYGPLGNRSAQDGGAGGGIRTRTPPRGAEDFKSPASAVPPLRPLRCESRVWRRRPDSNRRIRVLQTLALPLGHVASADLAAGLRPRGSRGAGNGIRTRDPNLGKVVLYH